MKGILHKALEHKIRKRTQFAAHSLIHIIIYVEISLFRAGISKRLGLESKEFNRDRSANEPMRR